MVVAIIKEGIVTNLIVCDTVEHAQQLLPDAQCVDGDGVAIGDTYPPAPDGES